MKKAVFKGIVIKAGGRDGMEVKGKGGGNEEPSHTELVFIILFLFIVFKLWLDTLVPSL